MPKDYAAASVAGASGGAAADKDPKIDAQHPEYTKYMPMWAKCRDAVEGEDAIKDGGTKYLPKLGDQDSKEYEAYLGRASYFGASGRTVLALSGAVFAKPADVKVPAAQDELIKKRMGESGETLLGLSMRLVEENITTGRAGLLVDAPTEEEAAGASIEPFTVMYYAENVISWRERVVNGRKQLVRVVLTEDEDLSGEGYETKCRVRYRVLKLEPVANSTEWMYWVELWHKEEKPNKDGKQWIRDNRFTPTVRGGRNLYEIPFTFVNPGGCTPEAEKSPIVDLVNVNLSHFKNSADLEHGRHLCALPTPYAIGFKFKGDLKIGSGVAWKSEEPNAKAGYLEFTGAGLGHLKEGMEHKEAQMAVLGARLLEEQKKAAEAAATVMLRGKGEQSVLGKIATSCSEGLTKAAKWMLQWVGIDPKGKSDAIEIKLNNDFDVAGLDPTELTSLMSAVQTQHMSWGAWFFNMKRAGYYPQDTTEADERAKIAAGGPVQPPGTAADGGTGGVGNN